jgi:DNA polymerase-1
MIKISVDGELEHLGFRLLMQVHDELIGQCPKETAQECAEIIKHYMENPFLDPLSVPLVTEPKIVSNWKEGK